jgi:hypothetical protein
MRIPTLKTGKNVAITSNIDGPCAIDALTKRSTFCTVKEIPLSGPNFPPHDYFEQHHAQPRARQIKPRPAAGWCTFKTQFNRMQKGLEK